MHFLGSSTPKMRLRPGPRITPRPDPLAGGEGLALPSPRTRPPPLSALRAWSFGRSGRRAFPLFLFYETTTGCRDKKVHPEIRKGSPRASGVGKIRNFQSTRCRISETAQDRTKLPWLIESRIRPFDCAKINDLGWPWTADMHSAAEKMRLSEPTTKIWIKYRPILSAAKMDRQTTVGLSRTAIFNVFAGYFFGNFRDEASVIT